LKRSTEYKFHAVDSCLSNNTFSWYKKTQRTATVNDGEQKYKTRYYDLKAID